MRQIVLIGDSVVGWGYKTGWVASLSHAFIRSANVINAGVGGYNTRWILQNLKSDAPYVAPVKPQQESPLFVLLCLGANDAAQMGKETPEHVPLEEFTSKYQQIIDWIQTYLRPEHGILLMTPPPPSENHWARVWAEECKRPLTTSDRTVARTRGYRNAVIRIAESSNLPVVDLFKVMGVDEHSDAVGDWQKYFEDGIHFNELGDDLVFEAILQAIDENLGVRPSGLPRYVPECLTVQKAELRPYSTRIPKILLVGDTTTQFGFHGVSRSTDGWVTKLAKEFMRSAHIVNGGIAGCDSRLVLQNLSSVDTTCYLQQICGENPQILFSVVWFDDVIPNPTVSGNPILPQEYRENLIGIVNFLKEKMSSRVIVVTPCCLTENKERLNLFRDAAIDASITSNVHVVECDFANDSSLDGLNAKLFDQLMATISRFLDPTKVPWDLPHYLSLPLSDDRA